VLLASVAAGTVLGVAAARQWRRPVATHLIAAPTPPTPAVPPEAAALAARRSAAGAGLPGSIAAAARSQGAAAPGDPRLPHGLPAPAPPAPTPTPRLTATVACREGVVFDVEPDRALVTVNGEPVGEAGTWGDRDDPLELPRAGTYYVRLSCPGCRARWFKVVVGPEAKDAVVRLEARLEE